MKLYIIMIKRDRITVSFILSVYRMVENDDALDYINRRQQATVIRSMLSIIAIYGSVKL